MKVQLLEQLPIDNKSISADVFLGYVTKMSVNLDNMERPLTLHLISRTAANILKYPPQQVEPIYETSSNLLYQNKSGFKALLQWFLSRRRMRRAKPYNLSDTDWLQQLATIQITEKQALGYLLLAANTLGFLTEQILVFEAETHTLMRTVSEQDAKLAFLQFSHENKSKNITE